MCILCLASRWSRHVAAMVMPMVTLWALSQFLPQGFRFEINSPKLACVGILFVSLSWCELVMPRLSAWRARRAAALKERRRVETQEAMKRRKKATRRCRNCFTPYKDQSPGSGRFMCTFCGHVSKRPVLDLPVGAASASTCFSLSESAVEFLNVNGFFSVGSPKYWYERASFVRPSWIGVGPWIDGANWGVSSSWFGGSWPGSALYFGNAGFGWPGPGTLLGESVFGGERWFPTDSYFGVFWFVFRIFSQLLVFSVWIWRKVVMAEPVEETETDRAREVGDERDDAGGSSLEAKGKKARRKAEEKRLARLVKERQEAEEKKQREEVAKLVEERRLQRDSKLETEKEKVRETVATLGKGIAVQKESKKKEELSVVKDKVPAKGSGKNSDIQQLPSTARSVAVKLLRSFKDVGVKDKDPSVKGASNFFSKWGAFKYRGSVKRESFLQSRNAAAISMKPSSSLLSDSNPSKLCKAAVSSISSFPSASRSSTEFIGKHNEVCSSAWRQRALNNVTSHGSMEVSEDTQQRMFLVVGSGREENIDTSYASAGSIGNTGVSNFMGDISQQAARVGSSIFDRPCEQLLADPQCSISADVYENTCEPSGSRLCPLTQNTPFTRACVDEPVASAFVQCPRTSTNFDMSELSLSPSSVNVSTSIFLNNAVSKHSYDSLFLSSPSDTLAVTPLGTDANPSLSLCSDCMSSSNALTSMHEGRKNPSLIWEPVKEWDGHVFHDKWSQHNLTYASQLTTLPLDASYQKKDDSSQQTIVEPEFYLPSSLFSSEEMDHGECFCENRMCRQKDCLALQGMESTNCGWEDMDLYYRVPPEFVDCITHSLMQDPVITADGHSYERSAIEDWLKLHDTSPKTGEVLPAPPGGKGVDKTLRPNHILRCQIIEFQERVLQRSINSVKKQTAANARSDFPGHWKTTQLRQGLNSF